MVLEQSASDFALLPMIISHISYAVFVNIFMMSYNVYVTFYYSIADSIANTYMLIEKRQMQTKRPEPALLVYKATEP